MNKLEALNHIMDSVQVAEWVWGNEEATEDIRMHIDDVLQTFENSIREEMEATFRIFTDQPGLGR